VFIFIVALYLATVVGVFIIKRQVEIVLIVMGVEFDFGHADLLVVAISIWCPALAVINFG